MEIIIDAILIRISMSVYPLFLFPLAIPSSPIHSFSARPHRQLMLRLMRCTRGKRLNNRLGAIAFPPPSTSSLCTLFYCPSLATPHFQPRLAPRAPPYWLMACVINVSIGVVHTVPHKHMRTHRHSHTDIRTHTHSHLYVYGFRYSLSQAQQNVHNCHQHRFGFLPAARECCLVSVANSLSPLCPSLPSSIGDSVLLCSAGVVVIRWMCHKSFSKSFVASCQLSLAMPRDIPLSSPPSSSACFVCFYLCLETDIFDWIRVRLLAFWLMRKFIV